MSKFAKKRQVSRLTFSTRSSDVSKGSTPLKLLPVCFTLQKRDGEIEKRYRDSDLLVYRSSFLFSDTAIR